MTDGGPTSRPWPSVRSFSGQALARIRMPVGGIGTGGVSLGGRGQLVDWQLFNRPSMGFDPDCFFAIRVSGPAGSATRVLEAELTHLELAGAHGSPAPLAGLPRFREGEFRAAYPFGGVHLRDPLLPVDVHVGAFNPLVPGDAEASGLPALAYRVRVANPSKDPLEVSVCGSLPNVVGASLQPDRPDWRLLPGGEFELRHTPAADLLLGSHPDAVGESSGTLALLAVGGSDSHRLTWARRSWGDSLLDFWDDLTDDGRLAAPTEGAPVPIGSLVRTETVAPGQEAEFRFVVSWHFPVRYGWEDHAGGPPTLGEPAVEVGNHYAAAYDDAGAAGLDLVERWDELEAATLDFVESVVDTGLPAVMVDAALSNLAVLTTPVCFRIADGTFLGWEGQNPDRGSCHGSCTHVWNYQYAVEALFPELAWTMREVELVHSLDERGLMSFRVGLPLATHGTSWPTAAADGQMGAVLRLYRTHRARPDLERLRSWWPRVRRVMEFAWQPGGWDADRDGVMEGCQHNTMDVEYYGPSGVIQSWYLAALAAAAELAVAVGDQEFEQICRGLLAEGCRRTDELVFNGDYYEQVVMPPGSPDDIAEGLRIRYDHPDADEGSDDLVDPDLQIGPGCTSDQLVGHTMARVSGLVVPLDPDHVTRAHRAVYDHNHRDQLHGHVNHLRTFAAGDEAGLLTCTYPRGGRPTRPFPYCHEVWTGLEYTAAVGLLAEGDLARAERVVADVRARYDGVRRNPFDEVECGHHYVRSMASWGLVEAWSQRTARP